MDCDINFNEHTIKEIDTMISEGKCTEQDVVRYYNNQWWRDGGDADDI